MRVREEQAEYLQGKGKINLENEGEKRWAQGGEAQEMHGKKEVEKTEEAEYLPIVSNKKRRLPWRSCITAG